MNPREGKALPVVAFKIKGERHYDEFAIATMLRSKNWIIPAYRSVIVDDECLTLKLY